MVAGCYDYEINSGIQQDVERNQRRDFCLQKKQGRGLEVEWHATGGEVLKFGDVRYRGSYSSVRGAQCHCVTIRPTFRRKTVLLTFSVKQSYKIPTCEDGVCVIDTTTKQT